eukprot:841766-Pyramimonas_sp.AAC.1
MPLCTSPRCDVTGINVDVRGAYRGCYRQQCGCYRHQRGCKGHTCRMASALESRPRKPERCARA